MENNQREELVTEKDSINFLFGTDGLNEMLNDKDIPDDTKFLVRTTGLVVAADALYRVSTLMKTVLPENSSNQIPLVLSKMAESIALASKRILETQEPEKNEYQIPESELEDLMKILESVDIKLPDDLK